jgi:prepilin-type N-terminal cleavage/methylation domain-containing protein
MKTKRNGFTLIELLVVIALIGVIAAIALPNFGSVKDEGIPSKCKANLQAIEMALETYYSENNAYPTPGDLDTLKEEGYLKLRPECKSGDVELGQYTWKVEATAGTIFEYYREGTKVGETSLTYGPGRAICTFHGTLEPADFYPNGYEEEAPAEPPPDPPPGGEPPPPPPG